GIKTGYTDVSGYNLVSSAIINGRHLVGVVLGAGSARQRDDQMAKLLTRFSTVSADTKAQLVAVAKPLPVVVKHAAAAAAQPKVDAVSDLIDDSRIEQGDGGFLIASAENASVWTIQLGAPPTL